MGRLCATLMCAVLLWTGLAFGQEQAAPSLENRVRVIVTACANAVAGAPVGEAFGALPLGQARVMRQSILALVAPELVDWFGPDASVSDRSFASSEGNAFVYADETGSRCRVQAFTYEPSSIADVARQALNAQSSVWTQNSPDLWSAGAGSTARVQANELMTGGSEVIVEFARAAPGN